MSQGVQRVLMTNNGGRTQKNDACCPEKCASFILPFHLFSCVRSQEGNTHVDLLKRTSRLIMHPPSLSFHLRVSCILRMEVLSQHPQWTRVALQIARTSGNMAERRHPYLAAPCSRWQRPSARPFSIKATSTGIYCPAVYDFTALTP